MGDLFLDLRDPASRRNAALDAAARFKFCEDTRVTVTEGDFYSVVTARVDQEHLWSPFVHHSTQGRFIVALSGRIALESSEWDAANVVQGGGGLACKAVYSLFRDFGLRGLAKLNGNFAVALIDETCRTAHIVTDRAGMVLVYTTSKANNQIFCTHPDVLARITGDQNNIDSTSLGQFLMTGGLTFPHTHYKNVYALDTGTIHTLSATDSHPSRCKYFDFKFQLAPNVAEADLAEDLAHSFKSAVRRRSLPLLGKTAVALSGGLDSRVVLSLAGRDVHAWTLFDQPNTELRTSESIAAALRIPLKLFPRDDEYYARTALQGVRIASGMCSAGSNHFLGVREQVRDHGFTNLLTGCHCDYLFKALSLNTTESPVLRRQKIAPFQHHFYRPHFPISTSVRDAVIDRLNHLFKDIASEKMSSSDWLEVERRRTFPLAYEGDAAQRLIPQRVMPWYPLMVDNDILNTYLRTPSQYKLNASLFRKMLLLVCPKEVLQVPDSNTGSAVDASNTAVAVHKVTSALKNRVVKVLRPGRHTRGSWLNWSYYVQTSTLCRQLWENGDPGSREIIRSIVGDDNYHEDLSHYQGRNAAFFVRLLTLKLWLDLRNS